MRGKPLQRPTIAVGDFVFAKLRGYRPWPARVLARHGSHSNVKYNVFFYGTCNTAKVSPIHILDFAQNTQRLGVLRSKRSSRNADFRGAMAHIRRAFEKPEHDFVYYQVRARTVGEGASSVTYETLTSTTETESETGSGDSTETPETHKPRATEQNSEEEDHTKETESTSEKDEEPQPSKKPKISKPLLDEEDDDQGQTLKAMEKELKLDEEDDDQDQTLKAMEKLKPKNVSSDLFSDTESDSFEFEGNPIVRSSPLNHFNVQNNSSKMSIDKLKIFSDSDSDDDSENDQTVNLCCRHITGDEQ